MKTNCGISKLYSLLLSTVLLFAIPAHATFPGKNGRIAFVEAGEIFTMNPEGTNIKQLSAS